jgi:hypothetical protein
MQKLDSESYEILGTTIAQGFSDAYLETQGGGILGVVIPALMNGTHYALITPNWGLGFYNLDQSSEPVFSFEFEFEDDEQPTDPLWSQTSHALEELKAELGRWGY